MTPETISRRKSINPQVQQAVNSLRGARLAGEGRSQQVTRHNVTESPGHASRETIQLGAQKSELRSQSSASKSIAPAGARMATQVFYRPLWLSDVVETEDGSKSWEAIFSSSVQLKSFVEKLGLKIRPLLSHFSSSVFHIVDYAYVARDTDLKKEHAARIVHEQKFDPEQLRSSYNGKAVWVYLGNSIQPKEGDSVLKANFSGMIYRQSNQAIDLVREVSEFARENFFRYVPSDQPEKFESIQGYLLDLVTAYLNIDAVMLEDPEYNPSIIMVKNLDVLTDLRLVSSPLAGVEEGRQDISQQSAVTSNNPRTPNLPVPQAGSGLSAEGGPASGGQTDGVAVSGARMAKYTESEITKIMEPDSLIGSSLKPNFKPMGKSTQIFIIYGSPFFYIEIPRYQRADLEYARPGSGRVQLRFKSKPHLQLEVVSINSNQATLIFTNSITGEKQSQNITWQNDLGRSFVLDNIHLGQIFMDTFNGIPTGFGVARATALRDWFLSPEMQSRIVHVETSDSVGLGGPRNAISVSADIANGTMLVQVLTEKRMYRRFVLFIDGLDDNRFLAVEKTRDGKIVDVATGEPLPHLLANAENSADFFQKVSRRLILGTKKINKTSIQLTKDAIVGLPRETEFLYLKAYGVTGMTSIGTRNAGRHLLRSAPLSNTLMSRWVSFPVFLLRPEFKKPDTPPSSDLDQLQNDPNYAILKKPTQLPYIGHFFDGQYHFLKRVERGFVANEKPSTVGRKISPDHPDVIFQMQMVDEKHFTIAGVNWKVGPKSGRSVRFTEFINLATLVEKYRASNVMTFPEPMLSAFPVAQDVRVTYRVPELRFENDGEPVIGPGSFVSVRELEKIRQAGHSEYRRLNDMDGARLANRANEETVHDQNRLKAALDEAVASGKFLTIRQLAENVGRATDLEAIESVRDYVMARDDLLFHTGLVIIPRTTRTSDEIKESVAKIKDYLDEMAQQKRRVHLSEIAEATGVDYNFVTIDVKSDPALLHHQARYKRMGQMALPSLSERVGHSSQATFSVFGIHYSQRFTSYASSSILIDKSSAAEGIIRYRLQHPALSESYLEVHFFKNFAEAVLVQSGIRSPVDRLEIGQHDRGRRVALPHIETYRNGRNFIDVILSIAPSGVDRERSVAALLKNLAQDEPKLSRSIGTSLSINNFQLVVSKLFHKGKLPIRIYSDKLRDGRFFMLEDALHHNNRVVFEAVSANEVIVLGKNEKRFKREGSTTFFLLHEFEAGKNFYDRLNLRPANLTEFMDGTKLRSRTMFTDKIGFAWFNEPDISVDRRWLSSGNTTRIDRAAEGGRGYDSIVMVDLSRLQEWRSKPLSDSEVFFNDHHLVLPYVEDWIPPEFLVQETKGVVENFYYLGVASASDGERFIIYRKIDASQIIASIQIASDRASYNFDGLEIDALPVRFESGYHHLGLFLKILLDYSGDLSEKISVTDGVRSLANVDLSRIQDMGKFTIPTTIRRVDGVMVVGGYEFKTFKKSEVLDVLKDFGRRYRDQVFGADASGSNAFAGARLAGVDEGRQGTRHQTPGTSREVTGNSKQGTEGSLLSAAQAPIGGARLAKPSGRRSVARDSGVRSSSWARVVVVSILAVFVGAGAWMYRSPQVLSNLPFVTVVYPENERELRGRVELLIAELAADLNKETGREKDLEDLNALLGYFQNTPVAFISQPVVARVGSIPAFWGRRIELYVNPSLWGSFFEQIDPNNILSSDWREIFKGVFIKEARSALWLTENVSAENSQYTIAYSQAMIGKSSRAQRIAYLKENPEIMLLAKKAVTTPMSGELEGYTRLIQHLLTRGINAQRIEILQSSTNSQGLKNFLNSLKTFFESPIVSPDNQINEFELRKLFLRFMLNAPDNLTSYGSESSGGLILIGLKDVAWDLVYALGLDENTIHAAGPDELQFLTEEMLFLKSSRSGARLAKKTESRPSRRLFIRAAVAGVLGLGGVAGIARIFQNESKGVDVKELAPAPATVSPRLIVSSAIEPTEASFKAVTKEMMSWFDAIRYPKAFIAQVYNRRVQESVIAYEFPALVKKDETSQGMVPAVNPEYFSRFMKEVIRVSGQSILVEMAAQLLGKGASFWYSEQDLDYRRTALELESRVGEGYLKIQGNPADQVTYVRNNSEDIAEASANWLAREAFERYVTLDFLRWATGEKIYMPTEAAYDVSRSALLKQALENQETAEMLKMLDEASFTRLLSKTYSLILNRHFEELKFARERKLSSNHRGHVAMLLVYERMVKHGDTSGAEGIDPAIGVEFMQFRFNLTEEQLRPAFERVYPKALQKFRRMLDVYQKTSSQGPQASNNQIQTESGARLAGSSAGGQRRFRFAQDELPQTPIQSRTEIIREGVALKMETLNKEKESLERQLEETSDIGATARLREKIDSVEKQIARAKASQANLGLPRTGIGVLMEAYAKSRRQNGARLSGLRIIYNWNNPDLNLPQLKRWALVYMLSWGILGLAGAAVYLTYPWLARGEPEIARPSDSAKEELSAREQEMLYQDFSQFNLNDISEPKIRRFISNYISRINFFRQSESLLYPDASQKELAQRINWLVYLAEFISLAENHRQSDVQLGGGPAAGAFQIEPQSAAYYFKQALKEPPDSPIHNLIQVVSRNHPAVVKFSEQVQRTQDKLTLDETNQLKALIAQDTELQLLLFRIYVMYRPRMELTADDLQSSAFDTDQWLRVYREYNTPYGSWTLQPRNIGENAPMRYGLSAEFKVLTAFFVIQQLTEKRLSQILEDAGTIEKFTEKYQAVMSDYERVIQDAGVPVTRAFRRLRRADHVMSKPDRTPVQVSRALKLLKDPLLSDPVGFSIKLKAYTPRGIEPALWKQIMDKLQEASLEVYIATQRLTEGLSKGARLAGETRRAFLGKSLSLLGVAAGVNLQAEAQPVSLAPIQEQARELLVSYFNSSLQDELTKDYPITDDYRGWLMDTLGVPADKITAFTLDLSGIEQSAQGSVLRRYVSSGLRKPASGKADVFMADQRIRKLENKLESYWTQHAEEILKASPFIASQHENLQLSLFTLSVYDPAAYEVIAKNKIKVAVRPLGTVSSQTRGDGFLRISGQPTIEINVQEAAKDEFLSQYRPLYVAAKLSHEAVHAKKMLEGRLDWDYLLSNSSLEALSSEAGFWLNFHLALNAKNASSGGRLAGYDQSRSRIDKVKAYLLQQHHARRSSTVNLARLTSGSFKLVGWRRQLMDGQLISVYISRMPNKGIPSIDTYKNRKAKLLLFSIHIAKILEGKAGVAYPDWQRALKEVMKNAYAHGNQLDIEQPIFVHFDKGQNTITVYDMAVQDRASKLEWDKAGEADLYGSSSSDQAILPFFKVFRESVNVPDQKYPITRVKLVPRSIESDAGARLADAALPKERRTLENKRQRGTVGPIMGALIEEEQIHSILNKLEIWVQNAQGKNPLTDEERGQITKALTKLKERNPLAAMHEVPSGWRIIVMSQKNLKRYNTKSEAAADQMHARRQEELIKLLSATGKNFKLVSHSYQNDYIAMDLSDMKDEAIRELADKLNRDLSEKMNPVILEIFTPHLTSDDNPQNYQFVSYAGVSRPIPQTNPTNLQEAQIDKLKAFQQALQASKIARFMQDREEGQATSQVFDLQVVYSYLTGAERLRDTLEMDDYLDEEQGTFRADLIKKMLRVRDISLSELKRETGNQDPDALWNFYLKNYLVLADKFDFAKPWTLTNLPMSQQTLNRILEIIPMIEKLLSSDAGKSINEADKARYINAIKDVMALMELGIKDAIFALGEDADTQPLFISHAALAMESASQNGYYIKVDRVGFYALVQRKLTDALKRFGELKKMGQVSEDMLFRMAVEVDDEIKKIMLDTAESLVSELAKIGLKVPEFSLENDLWARLMSRDGGDELVLFIPASQGETRNEAAIDRNLETLAQSMALVSKKLNLRMAIVYHSADPSSDGNKMARLRQSAIDMARTIILSEEAEGILKKTLANKRGPGAVDTGVVTTDGLQTKITYLDDEGYVRTWNVPEASPGEGRGARLSQIDDGEMKKFAGELAGGIETQVSAIREKLARSDHDLGSHTIQWYEQTIKPLLSGDGESAKRVVQSLHYGIDLADFQSGEILGRINANSSLLALIPDIGNDIKDDLLLLDKIVIAMKTYALSTEPTHWLDTPYHGQLIDWRRYAGSRLATDRLKNRMGRAGLQVRLVRRTLFHLSQILSIKNSVEVREALSRFPDHEADLVVLSQNIGRLRSAESVAKLLVDPKSKISASVREFLLDELRRGALGDAVKAMSYKAEDDTASLISAANTLSILARYDPRAEAREDAYQNLIQLKTATSDNSEFQGFLISIASLNTKLPAPTHDSGARLARDGSVAFTSHIRNWENQLMEMNNLALTHFEGNINGVFYEFAMDEPVYARYLRAGRVILAAEDLLLPISATPDEYKVLRSDSRIQFSANEAPIITAMQASQINGQIVEELGSGKGALTLASLALGADRVVSVDKGIEKLKSTKLSLEKNGYQGQLISSQEWKDDSYTIEPKAQFIMIESDLNDWFLLSEEKRATVFGGRKTIKLAETGPAYSIHDATIRFVLQSTDTEFALLGGFVSGNSEVATQLKVNMDFSETLTISKLARWNVSFSSLANISHKVFTVLKVSPPVAALAGARLVAPTSPVDQVTSHQSAGSEHRTHDSELIKGPRLALSEDGKAAEVEELAEAQVIGAPERMPQDTRVQQIYDYLVNEFELQEKLSSKGAEKVRGRIQEVADLIFKSGSEGFDRARGVVHFVRDDLGISLKKMSWGNQSKLLTVVYGIARSKQNSVQGFIKVFDRILDSFGIDKPAALEDASKQRLLTASFYVYQAKANPKRGLLAGIEYFEDAVREIQSIFDLDDQALKQLELSEKIRLITAAYNVSLGKKEGLSTLQQLIIGITNRFEALNFKTIPKRTKLQWVFVMYRLIQFEKREEGIIEKKLDGILESRPAALGKPLAAVYLLYRSLIKDARDQKTGARLAVGLSSQGQIVTESQVDGKQRSLFLNAARLNTEHISNAGELDQDSLSLLAQAYRDRGGLAGSTFHFGVSAGQFATVQFVPGGVAALSVVGLPGAPMIDLPVTSNVFTPKVDDVSSTTPSIVASTAIKDYASITRTGFRVLSSLGNGPVLIVRPVSGDEEAAQLKDVLEVIGARLSNVYFEFYDVQTGTRIANLSSDPGSVPADAQIVYLAEATHANLEAAISRGARFASTEAVDLKNGEMAFLPLAAALIAAVITGRLDSIQGQDLATQFFRRLTKVDFGHGQYQLYVKPSMDRLSDLVATSIKALARLEIFKALASARLTLQAIAQAA